MFFTFPEDARWNAERQAVEFGVEIGEYHGGFGFRGACLKRLLPERPTPERCVAAYYLRWTRFESIAERKLRRRESPINQNEGTIARFCPSSVISQHHCRGLVPGGA
jgi:hypothetical protein